MRLRVQCLFPFDERDLGAYIVPRVDGGPARPLPVDAPARTARTEVGRGGAVRKRWRRVWVGAKMMTTIIPARLEPASAALKKNHRSLTFH